MFLTLGLAFAVPISAIVDIYMYEVVFEGMKLAGILLILLGFMLVQLPDDWPDYLTMLLRYRLVDASENSPLGMLELLQYLLPVMMMMMMMNTVVMETNFLCEVLLVSQSLRCYRLSL